MADSTETKSNKASTWDKLTPEQKAERLAKMKAGKEAKKAQREASGVKTVELKRTYEKPAKEEKKSKKTTDEETEEKPKKTSWWDKLTPEQREERLAKMKAGKEAKKTGFKLTPEEREKMLNAFDDDVLEGTTDQELKEAYDALMKKRAGRKVTPMPKDE